MADTQAVAPTMAQQVIPALLEKGYRSLATYPIARSATLGELRLYYKGSTILAVLVCVDGEVEVYRPCTESLAVDDMIAAIP